MINTAKATTKLKDNTIFRTIVIIIAIFMMFVFRFCFSGSFILEGTLVEKIAGAAPGTKFVIYNNLLFGVVGIFIGALILWLIIGIDWPSILVILALGFLQIEVEDNKIVGIGFATAITSSFGNSTFIFLLFTFACTYALSQTAFIKRIAIKFIINKLARKNGWWFTVLFLTACLLLGLFISPSVLFMILLPILKEIISLAKLDNRDKVSKMLMIGLGFTMSISSGMTPIGHVFPILALQVANFTNYGLYMAYAIPVGLILFIFMILVFRFILRPDVSKLTNLDLDSIKNEIPKTNKYEIITLVVFLITALLWIIPSFFKDTALNNVYVWLNNYGTAMPPILGTVLLCIIRDNNKKPLLNIVDALKKGVPWPSLLMCAGTLALSSALTNNKIGLHLVLGTYLHDSLTGFLPFVLLLIFVIWAMIQTNVSSNMVTATLVGTISYLLLNEIPGINAIAVLAIVGFISSLAFATPPSMPHIAIIADGEYCSTTDVLIYGSIMMVISTLVFIGSYYALGQFIF